MEKINITKVLYYLYLSRGHGEMEEKLIFIGTRDRAQDLVSDLIEAHGENALSPLDFSLEEIVTIGGIVISQKLTDI